MSDFNEYELDDDISFADMLAVSQNNVSCSVSGVGDDVIVHSLHGVEEISALFSFSVNILSENDSLDGSQLVGSNITVTIGDEPRYINGIVSEFSHGVSGRRINYVQYTAKIRPKCWLLTLNKNCKVFQEKSACDIITSILSDTGIEFVDNTSSRGKGVRNYCVQYNESDFDFISRLMEEEGIFYYFQHTSDSHKMVLCDSAGGYADISGDKKVPFVNFDNDIASFDTINNVKRVNSYCPGKYATTDYNYTVSTTDLAAQLQGKNSSHEVFEYPGKYDVLDSGNTISKTRLQELERNADVIFGLSKVFRFSAGYKFDLDNPASQSFNKTYAIFRVEHSLNLQKKGIYENRFSAIESTIIWRAQKKTRKPFISGTQTAVVTGPDGEEIYTDNFRRVKVHFHWDREGEKNENSSCWVRVAQIWAGNNWGGLYTPRIGQEVVVSFENGDPDRPIIVGCVYNDKHMPPYVDTDATKSAVKSVSSKGEEGFNELRFEDLKDSEEIYVHAQKDMHIDIVNERTTLIEESDDTLTISNGSRTELLNAEGDNPGNYATTLVKGDKTLTINEGNWNVALDKGDNTVTLTKGNMSITLSDGNMDVSIKGNYSISVDGDLSISTTGKITVEAQKDISMSSKANVSIEATQNFKTASTMNTQMEAKQNFTAAATMNMMVDGKVNSTVKAGVAMNVMGTNITVNGSAAVNVSGGASTNIASPSVVIGGGVVVLG